MPMCLLIDHCGVGFYNCWLYGPWEFLIHPLSSVYFSFLQLLHRTCRGFCAFQAFIVYSTPSNENQLLFSFFLLVE